MTTAYQEVNEQGGTDEQFIASGEATSVLDADAQAWQALESCLDRDPVTAWKLGRMIHAYKEPGLMEWAATFVRDPEAEVPPIEPIAMDDIPTLTADPIIPKGRTAKDRS